MKKTYVKPEVHFESFELSTNIAYACGKPTHTPKHTDVYWEYTEKMN